MWIDVSRSAIKNYKQAIWKSNWIIEGKKRARQNAINKK